MDPKTVLGFYLSSFNFLQGCILYYVLWIVTMGWFISLSIYVDAFTEDFKTTVISEMNDEIRFEIKKCSKSQKNNNDSSAKLTEAILLRYEMLKYLPIF